MSAILVTEHQLSVSHACRVAGLSRTAWYRRPAEPATRDGAVIEALRIVAWVVGGVERALGRDEKSSER